MCGTCARRRTAHRLMTELHHTAVTTLQAWLPTFDDGLVVAAVIRAAPNFRQAAWLVGALTDVEVLHASTTAPPVIDRLVTELVSAGAVGIAAPRCVRCGRSDWLTQRLDGHRACVNCAHRARVETCGRCGQQRGVTTRDPGGAAVCGVCFNKDRSRWETCARCATLTRPARRLDDGTALCRACNRPTAVCVECGLERPCDGVRTGRFRCESCSRRKAGCSRCGRVATVAVVWRRPAGRYAAGVAARLVRRHDDRPAARCRASHPVHHGPGHGRRARQPYLDPEVWQAGSAGAAVPRDQRHGRLPVRAAAHRFVLPEKTWYLRSAHGDATG